VAKDVGQAKLLGRRLPDVATVVGVSEQKLKPISVYFLYTQKSIILFFGRIYIYVFVYIFFIITIIIPRRRDVCTLYRYRH